MIRIKWFLMALVLTGVPACEKEKPATKAHEHKEGDHEHKEGDDHDHEKK